MVAMPHQDSALPKLHIRYLIWTAELPQRGVRDVCMS